MEIELLAVFCTEIFYYILKKKDTNNIDPIIKLPPEGDKLWMEQTKRIKEEKNTKKCIIWPAYGILKGIKKT